MFLGSTEQLIPFLIQRRKNLNMSELEVAAAASLMTIQICDFESHRREPALTELFKWITALGMMFNPIYDMEQEKVPMSIGKLSFIDSLMLLDHNQTQELILDFIYLAIHTIPADWKHIFENITSEPQDVLLLETENALTQIEEDISSSWYEQQDLKEFHRQNNLKVTSYVMSAIKEYLIQSNESAFERAQKVATFIKTALVIEACCEGGQEMEWQTFNQVTQIQLDLAHKRLEDILKINTPDNVSS